MSISKALVAVVAILCGVCFNVVGAGERADLDGVWNLVYESARESVLTGMPPSIMTEAAAEKTQPTTFFNMIHSCGAFHLVLAV